MPENDYPAWAAPTSYALGARVIVASTHRVFESAVAGNQGHDPLTSGSAFWVDAGPTNRWAMFDAAAGPATTAAAVIAVTLALGDSVDAIGLVDLQAESVRIEIAAAGVTIFDATRGAPAACEVFLGLPAATGRSATITIAPTGGAAIVGKLITGAALDLGTLADAPTVGLTDFSRRETDAFGVTTIAERGWTKRIEAKCLIDAAAVDGIQRQLAAIRAQAALWVGEGDVPSLISYGFFKDFSQIISLQGVSTCALSIDGLPAADIAVPVSDPAFSGASDFQVLRPVLITEAALVASSVPENDYPVYSPDRTYIAGERVILPLTHRAYESAVGGNHGNDPATDTVHWLDVGPTKRWAMFDQALGTATTAVGAFSVQLRPGIPVDALALLDVAGATVRVQAPGYDQTRAVGGDVTTALFLDLALTAGETVMVTIAGADSGAAVAVGTLLIGTREGLGTIADEPNISILDFSVKDTDDFGNTVPIERAWAKRMEAKSQIATGGADALLRRLATLRAKPALWIGAAEFDALTIYGFFRDFTVTLGEQVSTTSVTIEGLAKASPDGPSNTVVTWENIVGPGKPADNATVGAPAGTNVGGVPAEDIADAVKDANGNVVPAREQFAAVKAQIDAEVGSAQTDAAHARDDAAAARTDLSIEVQRAKDAEGAINTTLASVKATADQAKAGVTDEATVRSAADVALANRLTTTEAQLAGTQGSVLSGRITDESTARANADNAIASRTSATEAQLAGTQASQLQSRISNEETARAGGDSALANRATALESTVGSASGALNANPGFSVWLDGQRLPAEWQEWGGIYTLDRYGDGRPTRSWCVHHAVPANVDAGILQALATVAAAGWYVIDVDVDLNSGTWRGSGVTISGQYNLAFHNQADNAGIVSETQLGNRRWSFLLQKAADPYGNFHIMTSWAGFGTATDAKDVVWHRCSIRPANDAEIKAGKASVDVATALARIGTEETTRASQDTALANRISSTEAQLAGTQGSQLQARISNEETARANQDAAIANRTSTVEAQLSGAQASQLGSRITTTESAIAGLNGRTAAYWQVQAIAGNNRAQVTLWADANAGAGADIVGDVRFLGQNGNGTTIVGNTGVNVYYPNGQIAVQLGI
ncbi:hypothetical protein [Sphingomonas azotifigens]|uniref:hypothetical protein n=1 Tax=Sphingomonas azotifigens TaxID=330920 RepID=UPI00111BEDA5|nr:hypothetical protein [Sphingomonas azotifigens]